MAKKKPLSEFSRKRMRKKIEENRKRIDRVKTQIKNNGDIFGCKDARDTALQPSANESQTPINKDRRDQNKRYDPLDFHGNIQGDPKDEATLIEQQIWADLANARNKKLKRVRFEDDFDTSASTQQATDGSEIDNKYAQDIDRVYKPNYR
ncbi:hypothetical protein TrVGV298_007039 [Trichoderma virens]|nr:hypothetical protein TrVGV298_007039 [Trichoderma virens]